ncbi:MAG: Gfo/Idh/MocA family oxidoreductase [Planctomycetota bacterium]
MSSHRPSLSSESSRRGFLAGSAALAASPLLAAKGASRRDDLIRVGLVGCGGRGTGAAAQALRTSAGPVQLVAMGDAFGDRLDKSHKNLLNAKGAAERVNVGDKQRFVGLDAFERVLDSGIDLVILATPPHFRPAHFEAAVERGVHVFMEKPVAVDGWGVRTVLAAGEKAKEKRLAVGVGLQRHHQAGYIETMRRVHAGAIGDIVAARCYWNMGSLWHVDRAPEMSDIEWQMRNWLYFAWLSGDHIVEQHIHNLDVIHWAKQAWPVRACGMGGRQVRTDPRFGHIYDHHAVHYEYADGAFLFSQCRQIDGCWNSVSEHLIGTEGRADMDTGNWRITGKKGDWRFEGDNNDPYQTEHDDLHASIRAGKPINEAEYGAKSTLSAILGRMATYSGKMVTWEEALASPRIGPDRYDGPYPTPPVATPGQ